MVTTISDENTVSPRRRRSNGSFFNTFHIVPVITPPKIITASIGQRYAPSDLIIWARKSTNPDAAPPQKGPNSRAGILVKTSDIPMRIPPEPPKGSIIDSWRIANAREMKSAVCTRRLVEMFFIKKAPLENRESRLKRNSG